jgi:hypothetical protein
MIVARNCYRFLAATVLTVLATQSPAAIPKRRAQRPIESPLGRSADANPNAGSDYGKVPLAFEPNVGQTDARSPHFPRAGVPQDQSRKASEGYGCGRFATLSASRALGFDPPPGRDIKRASRLLFVAGSQTSRRATIEASVPQTLFHSGAGGRETVSR